MSQLGEAHDAIHNHHLSNRAELTKIRINTCIKEDKVKLTSPTAVSVYADSTTPIADEDDRKGWLFKKAADDTTKFNYYFYGTGSHPFPLSSLNNVFMTCSVDLWQNSASVPFVVVYTKATGSGDAGSWYKSKVAYALSSNKKIVAGELINLYCVENPNLKNGNRDVRLKTKITTGTADPSEEILTISVQSDSAALMNTKILVSHVGYKLNNEISRNIALIS
jgi:hypothetical protein